MIRLKGSTQFRARLVGSVLSSKSVAITNIRESEEAPGLREFEVSFLKLVEKITNGTRISINSSGTAISFKPGLISGGTIEHDCNGTGRSVGYFLEGVVPLCLFSKKPTRITFTGVTSDDIDICIETLNAVTIPLLSRFGLEELPQIKMVRRGCPPDGKGVVSFACPIVRELKAVQLTDVGYVKKVRGVAHAVRVSPQFANRMVDTCRSILNNFLPDVYINTDHAKGSAVSEFTGPGFGIFLFAETTNGFFYGAKRTADRKIASKEDDCVIERKDVEALTDPEELGLNVAKQLCEEIARGGCVDTSLNLY
mmetsp:Transcript_29370/g.36303  ORF Transcript_29370/g.36303 Transcript_29370/m.36303 type:complete len:310 (-) Transcript_29370:394-1323(-)